jgi:hypothetical protein
MKPFSCHFWQPLSIFCPVLRTVLIEYLLSENIQVMYSTVWLSKNINKKQKGRFYALKEINAIFSYGKSYLNFVDRL